MASKLTREEAADIILTLLHDGYIAPQIRQMMNNAHNLDFSETDSILSEFGVSPEVQIDNNYQSSKSNFSLSSSALIGLVIMIAGIVFTLWTYNMVANSPTGGTYVVAWGAIAYGGFRFLSGLVE